MYLVDLEWACSRLAETIYPLYWLTNQSVDRIDLTQGIYGVFCRARTKESFTLRHTAGRIEYRDILVFPSTRFLRLVFSEPL